MKAIKLFGISVALLGIMVLSSGCTTCGMPKCEPIDDCTPACAPVAPCAPAPVVNTCNPCG